MLFDMSLVEAREQFLEGLLQWNGQQVITAVRAGELWQPSHDGVDRGAECCFGVWPVGGRDHESGRGDSNPRHTAWEAVTLPTELRPRKVLFLATSSGFSFSRIESLTLVRHFTLAAEAPQETVSKIARVMNGTPNQRKWRPRFTSRALLMLTLLVALLLAWRWSVQDSAMRLAHQANRLRYAGREELDDRTQLKRDKARGLWNAEFDGAYLRGVTIASPTNAFQRASVKNCDLENAKLQGGAAAFQFAQFDD